MKALKSPHVDGSVDKVFNRNKHTLSLSHLTGASGISIGRRLKPRSSKGSCYILDSCLAASRDSVGHCKHQTLAWKLSMLQFASSH